mmetsp:Transcript_24350/g.69800  ORF Transcript_24350/g.69800 Transcript_24350/m.69800 type:complete len:200 (+) Transcript_24350:750-1349(+)
MPPRRGRGGRERGDRGGGKGHQPVPDHAWPRHQQAGRPPALGGRAARALPEFQAHPCAAGDAGRQFSHSARGQLRRLLVARLGDTLHAAVRRAGPVGGQRAQRGPRARGLAAPADAPRRAAGDPEAQDLGRRPRRGGRRRRRRGGGELEHGLCFDALLRGTSEPAGGLAILPACFARWLPTAAAGSPLGAREWQIAEPH